MKKFLLLLLVACKCLMASVFQLQDGNENNQAITLNNNDGNGFQQNFEQIINIHSNGSQFQPQVNENLFAGNDWNMPGLGAFVPDQNNPNLVNVVLGVPPLNQPINFLDANSNHSAHGTILIAKQKQNNNQMFFSSELVKTFHTERQLVDGLLNRTDISNNTNGNLYVYTRWQPCQNLSDNQGLSCITYYNRLRERFQNINIQVFFRDQALTKETIADPNSPQLLQNLVLFLEDQFNHDNQPNFEQTFPGYKFNNQTLQYSNRITTIIGILARANINDGQITEIKNNLTGLNVVVNGVTGIDNATIGNIINPILGNQLRTDIKNVIIHNPNIADNHWANSSNEQKRTWVGQVNTFINPNNQNCPEVIKNGIFNAIYTTPGVTYTKIG